MPLCGKKKNEKNKEDLRQRSGKAGRLIRFCLGRSVSFLYHSIHHSCIPSLKPVLFQQFNAGPKADKIRARPLQYAIDVYWNDVFHMITGEAYEQP